MKQPDEDQDQQKKALEDEANSAQNASGLAFYKDESGVFHMRHGSGSTEPVTSVLSRLGSTLSTLNNSMSQLSGTVFYIQQKSVSRDFYKDYIKFVSNPESDTSRSFVQDFIKILAKPCLDQAETHGAIAIVTPMTFAFNLDLLAKAQILAGALLEYEMYDNLKELLDITLDSFLPNLENNVVTVMLNDNKAGQKKNIEFSIKPFKVYLTAALMHNFRAIYFVARNEVRNAESDLSRAKELCDHQHFDLNSIREKFAVLLKSKAKTFRGLYNANKSEWKEAFKAINTVDEKTLENSINMLHYFVWAKIALCEERPNFALVECYCDLTENYYGKLKVNDKCLDKLAAPQNVAKLLHRVADGHKDAGLMNSALRCYLKAQRFYQKCQRVIIDGKSKMLATGYSVDIIDREVRNLIVQILAIQRSVKEIQFGAFSQFQQEWTALKPSFAIQVRFEEQGFAMIIDFDDKVLLKIWAQQLKCLKLPAEPLRSTNAGLQNSIRLLEVHQLSAQQICQSLLRAQKVQQADKIRMQKRCDHLAIIKNRKDAELAKLAQEKLSDVSDSMVSVESDPSKDLYPVTRPILKKDTSNKAKSQRSAATAAPLRVQPVLVDWAEDLPDYINVDEVCPFPDPFVTNSSIPKGLFYGYIDYVMMNGEAISDELLAEFRSVLGRGKIAAEDNSQGIRPVQGELGHESDYMFKLNVHGEDYRLYGRWVADKKLPNGQVVVLIAFDQAVPHDKTLKHEHTSSAPTRY